MRIWFLLFIGLGGIAILLRLGFWQLDRLAWKEDLLANIEAQIVADPVPSVAALSPDFQRYAPVVLNGQFGTGHIRMLASRKGIGPAYRIIRPFKTVEGQTLLVDLGWIPDNTDVPPAPDHSVMLIGNLDAPNETDQFTPEPDLNANLWFARDVPAMAAHLGTDPVLVVLRSGPTFDLGVTPWPVDTAGIPNDHLQYAVTWFSLAVIWGAMTIYFLHRTRRRML